MSVRARVSLFLLTFVHYATVLSGTNTSARALVPHYVYIYIYIYKSAIYHVRGTYRWGDGLRDSRGSRTRSRRSTYTVCRRTSVSFAVRIPVDSPTIRYVSNHVEPTTRAVRSKSVYTAWSRFSGPGNGIRP